MDNERERDAIKRMVDLLGVWGAALLALALLAFFFAFTPGPALVCHDTCVIAAVTHRHAARAACGDFGCCAAGARALAAPQHPAR